MKYFSTPGGIRALEQDGSQDDLIESDWAAVSEVEKDAIIAAAADPVVAAKLTRDATLNSLTHDFGDGRVIQVRPKDESNIRNAIGRMQRLGITSRGWFMADDTWRQVTAAELQTALESGQDQGAEAWETFATTLGA